MIQEIVGTSPAFQRVLNAARLVAATDAPVLLYGEPGTGRATLAGEIHRLSPACQRQFLLFACAGAPAGALDRWLGETTSAGTLYFDEVGELSQSDQARVYRVLAELDSRPADSGPRILASSSLDLGEAVDSGRFRRDLYLRLCVVPLEVPPLRERVLDIPALTAHFLAEAARRHRSAQPYLNAGAERLFRRYRWPGNVRELANLCERLVILLPGGRIAPEYLPREMIAGDRPPETTGGITLPAQGIDLNGLEAELIRQALALAGGNKSRAARLLGLTRDTFLYRIRKYVIPA